MWLLILEGPFVHGGDLGNEVAQEMTRKPPEEDKNPNSIESAFWCTTWYCFEEHLEPSASSQNSDMCILDVAQYIHVTVCAALAPHILQGII